MFSGGSAADKGSTAMQVVRPTGLPCAALTAQPNDPMTTCNCKCLRLVKFAHRCGLAETLERCRHSAGHSARDLPVVLQQYSAIKPSSPSSSHRATGSGRPGGLRKGGVALQNSVNLSLAEGHWIARRH